MNDLNFAGYAVRDVYTQAEENELVGLLTAIAKKYNVVSSLIEPSEFLDALYVNHNLTPQLLIKVGPLRAFDEASLAQIVFEQSRIYADLATMGKKFPRGDQSSEEELIASFLNVSPETVVISVQYIGPGVRKIIGGCMVALNSSEKNVLEVLESGANTSSAIPTFQALYVKDVNDTFRRPLENKLEKDVANPVRFWRQDVETLKRLHIEDRFIAQKVVACIPLSYVTHSLSKKRSIPSLAIVDTHDEGIIRLIEEFGAKPLASNGILSPTKTILEGVLKYHYGGESVGGYFGKISISFFETNTFLKKAAEYLHEIEPRMWEKYESQT